MTRCPLTPRLLRSCLVLLAVAPLVAPVPGAATTIYVAFGDSITEGWGFDDCPWTRPEQCGYPFRLERMLWDGGADVQVVNEGLGGERTPEALERINDVLRGRNVLLLMHGSNDISRQISLETTRFNLNLMAERAENRGLSVVHATVIPRIPSAPQDSDNVLTARLAGDLRQLAYNRGRRLADPFEVFGSVPDRFETIYSPPGGDVVGHPNPAGFQLLAEIFFDVIQEVDSVPPVMGFVEPPDGSEEVPPDAELWLRLFDFGAGIDLQATSLLVNGQPVAAQQVGDSFILDLRYRPPAGLSGLVRVGYRSRDRATPPNEVEREVAELIVEGTVFLPGDLNRDGRVDGADLVRLARAFGARTGQPRFDPAADLDGNGVVDGLDLAILAAVFGESS